MISNPLEQFEIFSLIRLPTILGYNVDFTNSSLYMLSSVFIMLLLCWIGLRRGSIIPNNCQVTLESCYEFIASSLESNTGKYGLNYIPFVLTVFTFVLSCNLLGMLPLPFSFTVTSHIAVTFAISMVVFIYVTVIGFQNQGYKFLRIFLPEGTPLWLAPMMVLIEMFAYLARPVSLSIRLAANMIAGHTIIAVIASFVLKLNIILGALPFAFVVILIGFEVFIAILQAYIFTVLTCVYLSDALNKH